MEGVSLTLCVCFFGRLASMVSTILADKGKGNEWKKLRVNTILAIFLV